MAEQLCVSNVLRKHLPRDKVKTEDSVDANGGGEDDLDLDGWFATDETCYGEDSQQGVEDETGTKNIDGGTGFKRQKEYNERLKKKLKAFWTVYQGMELKSPDDCPSPAFDAGKFTFKYTPPKSGSDEQENPDSARDSQPEQTPAKREVTLECGPEGLWVGGPLRIMEDEKTLWELKRETMGVPPWAKSRDCASADLERWIYEGIGTTTFFVGPRGRVALWSQEDTDGAMALTDGEKRMLAQRCQLFVKTKRKKLFKKSGVDTKQGHELFDDADKGEKEIEDVLYQHIEEGPCHNPKAGILQWRVKSLKKRLFEKCVFWTNHVDSVPGGSVADGTKTKPGSDGEGNEVLEFYKYKRKIGILRKTHVMEDRQRLLDEIERFTPDYKAVIKYKGAEEDDEGGSDHYMIDTYQKTICNVVALALDMHMPDYDEDRIACFIKTLVEKHNGPTWHVLVGRSFGFVIQCEARHFLHLYMRHLAVVIWKSEPDIKKGATRGGQAT